MATTRIYQLYSASAAAQSLSTIQVLKRCQVAAIIFSFYAAAGNGAASEISVQAARQWGTNNTTGILATAAHSVAAAATAVITSNQTVPFPPGTILEQGVIVYLHATQLGAGGTITQQIQIIVVED